MSLEESIIKTALEIVADDLREEFGYGRKKVFVKKEDFTMKADEFFTTDVEPPFYWIRLSVTIKGTDGINHSYQFATRVKVYYPRIEEGSHELTVTMLENHFAFYNIWDQRYESLYADKKRDELRLFQYKIFYKNINGKPRFSRKKTQRKLIGRQKTK